MIAVTPDLGETDPRPGRPALPRLLLKRAYLSAVEKAGGLPVVLAPTWDAEAIGQALDLCQGLVITGGAFDIPPAAYGAAEREGLGPLRPDRTVFEAAVLGAALDRGLPVLGVCGGMQLLAVVLGGTLFQDIRREIPGALEHVQPGDPAGPGHPVRLEAGSRLARAAGASALEVNSTHHQAVNHLPEGLRVSARAPDGVVEAVERTGGRFLVGVQWHPELLAAPHGAALYAALVEAARESG